MKAQTPEEGKRLMKHTGTANAVPAVLAGIGANRGTPYRRLNHATHRFRHPAGFHPVLVRFVFLLVGLSAVLATGCVGDPPRDNPFDPGSDAFQNVGSTAGSVTRFYTSEGIAGARVRVMPLSGTGTERVVQTGADGRFVLEDVTTGSYVLIADADGYAAVSDTVEIALGTNTEPLSFALDGLPGVVEQTVRTEHIDRWWPTDPLDNLIVEVRVSDPDGLGDVDYVVASIPELAFADTLRAVAGEPDRYARTFPASTLPMPFFSLLGRSVQVTVTDQVGEAGIAPGVQVVRIIDAFPQPVDPLTTQHIVGPMPTLRWIPLGLPFAFTYRVDVVFVPGPGQQVVVDSFTRIPSTETEVQVNTPLANGEYYWLLSVVDDLGNRSQARSAGFTVVNGPLP